MEKDKRVINLHYRAAPNIRSDIRFVLEHDKSTILEEARPRGMPNSRDRGLMEVIHW